MFTFLIRGKKGKYYYFDKNKTQKGPTCDNHYHHDNHDPQRVVGPSKDLTRSNTK